MFIIMSIHRKGNGEVMFFQEKTVREKRETCIPNTFFEQILPIVNPVMLKIYMYAYYLSKNPSDHADEEDLIQSNEDLAQKLDVTLDDVLSCWDFFESCGLIKKHRINEEQAQSFSVEFRNLHEVGLAAKPSKVTTDELLVAYQNEEYRKMYDQIEQTIQIPLMHYDMQKINEFINQYNVSKELVVEAMKFNLYRKKSKSVASALGILRNWHLDGIRSSQDLDVMLRSKEKRYLEYKKILASLGEYRLPTKPEEEMMDVWLDEYRFTIEVIEDALSRTTAIKSPNMNYLNGILKNWNEKLKEKSDEKETTGGSVPASASKSSSFEREDRTDFRAKILSLVRFTRKTMSRSEIDSLNFLYEHYHYEDIELAAKWLKEKGTPVSLENLCRILLDPSMNEESEKVTMEDIKKIETSSPDRYKPKNQSNPAALDGKPREMDELEKRLQKKLFEKLAKKEKDREDNRENTNENNS